jgi:hypothetical protein
LKDIGIYLHAPVHIHRAVLQKYREILGNAVCNRIFYCIRHFILLYMCCYVTVYITTPYYTHIAISYYKLYSFFRNLFEFEAPNYLECHIPETTIFRNSTTRTPIALSGTLNKMLFRLSLGQCSDSVALTVHCTVFCTHRLKHSYMLQHGRKVKLEK